MNSIERDRNSRYFLQVSKLFMEISVSIISSIWYRFRPTLHFATSFCENGEAAKTSPRNEVISSFWNHERAWLSSFKQLCLVRCSQRGK